MGGPFSPVSKGHSLEPEGRTWVVRSGLPLKLSWRNEWIFSTVAIIIDEPVLSTTGQIWNTRLLR